MSKIIAVLALSGVVVMVSSISLAAERAAEKTSPALSFKMNSLDGKEVDLSQYQGQVVLIVNVASYCGNTPQYKQLEALHEKYGKEGLAVLGFPCNQFGGQEPGTAED